MIFLGLNAAADCNAENGRKRGRVFRCDTEPTAETHGREYAAVVGPFRTVRGAKTMLHYGNNNPHIQHVSDAERIGRKYAADVALLSKEK